MAAPDTLRDLTKRINNDLRDIPSIYGMTTSQAPFSYGRLISNLVLLTEGQEILYVTGTYRASDKGLEAIVITDSLVIVARIADVSSDDAEVTARAIRRSSIESVSVSAAESAFTSTAFTTWPGNLAITATYPAANLTLPLEPPMNGDRTTPLRDLLAAMKADLAAASS